MPTIIVRTNVPRTAFPTDFLTKMTDILAESLGKPKKFVSVVVEAGLLMSFGGTDKRCASIWLGSMGKLGEKENIGHTCKIMDYVNECLGVEKDRMYITFQDSTRAEVGYNGTTFAAM